jgi:hypothetical protein
MNADTVIGLNVGLYPEPGAAAHVLLQDEQRAILIFTAITTDEQTVTAIAEFTGCLATRFGYPGDEALPGNPLYKHGLRYHDVMEVLHSSWLRQLEGQDAAAFPQPPDWEQPHFTITLHDSTFECLADELTIRTTDDPRAIVLLQLVEEPS